MSHKTVIDELRLNVRQAEGKVSRTVENLELTRQELAEREEAVVLAQQELDHWRRCLDLYATDLGFRELEVARDDEPF